MPRKAESGSSGVYENPKDSGVFWIRWYDESKKVHREKVGTRKAAEKLVMTRKSDVMAGRKLPKPRERNHTVADLVDRYSAEILSRNKKSEAEYRRHGEFWKKSKFGARTVVSLVAGDLETWKADRLKTHAGSTVNGSLRYLKMLINLAIRDKLADENPLAKGRVKMAREAAPRDRIVTPEEEGLLAEHCPRLFWLQTRIALYTGLRQAEHFAALRTDVDLQRRLWLLPDEKGNRSGANVTWVKLNQAAVDALQELFATTQGEYVYTSKTGGGIADGTYATKKLQRICGKLNFPPGITWHAFRHTFISRLCMMGVPLPTVQKLARHKSITMTLRYAHLCPSHEDAALEGLVNFAQSRGSTSLSTPGIESNSS